MIRLRRSRAASSVAAGFRTPKLQEKIRLLIDLYYEAKAANRPMDFKAAGWKPTKSRLKAESHGKCAYCEASTDTVAHGDVEHFRPKSRYWWLAFCYDNYLYACQICNQSFKSNEFPVSGPPLAGPAMPAVKPTGAALDALVQELALEATALDDARVDALWATEACDLVNPYLEDPAALFDYVVDADNERVLIAPRPGNRAERAFAAAHAHLGLNRPELCRDRYFLFPQLTLARRAMASTDPEVRRDARSVILTMQRPKYPFAGLARWYARQWNLPQP